MWDGTLDLPSGPWDWFQYSQAWGTMVHLRHRLRGLDEMFLWLAAPRVDAAAVAEAALDPVERIWADAEGQVWHVTLEARCAAGEVGPARMLDVVFRRGRERRVGQASAGSLLGQLEPEALADLFAHALPS